MEKHSLTEIVINLVRIIDTIKGRGLGNIEIYQTKRGTIFFLPFEPFRVKDPKSEKIYEFPGGHIGLVYNPTSVDLNYPFIREKYTHPLLMDVDVENQSIPIDPYLTHIRGDTREIPIESRIASVFENSLMVLKSGCNGSLRDMGLIPLYDLNMDLFRKYQIN